jgi:hypothetical protein
MDSFFGAWNFKFGIWNLRNMTVYPVNSNREINN